MDRVSCVAAALDPSGVGAAEPPAGAAAGVRGLTIDEASGGELAVRLQAARDVVDISGGASPAQAARGLVVRPTLAFLRRIPLVLRHLTTVKMRHHFLPALLSLLLLRAQSPTREVMRFGIFRVRGRSEASKMMVRFPRLLLAGTAVLFTWW